MITVIAGLIERNGHILIARRRRDDRHGHKWEFPGGKLEPNESPEECLRRELHEELGIQVQVGPLFSVREHDYPGLSIRLEVYRVLDVIGDPVALEHEELRWVLPEEIDGFDFPEADRPIVAEIARSGSACLPTSQSD